MKGSCLCQQVKYQLTPPIKLFQYCHCSRCQKVTGSAHGANIYITAEQLKWLAGEESIGRFEHPEAKYYATQFCKTCGSNLPWQVKGGDTVVVPAGTLDEIDGKLTPKQSIHWSSRAPWYEETSSICKFDTMPPRKPKKTPS
jgi:hypothetical protein